MKAFEIVLLVLFEFFSHNISGQQPVFLETYNEVGRGILRARSGECFVITPAHVVEKENRPFQVRGAKNVLSKGDFLRVYPPDLAIVRIIEGGNQNCEDWDVDLNYDRILAESADGFLEIAQENGAIQLMKVFLFEKDDTQIIIKPYLPNDQIIRGMSGCSLFTHVNGKKIYLGMLVSIQDSTTGIILQASTIEKVLSNFFLDKNKVKALTIEIAVIGIKGNAIDSFELAQKASDILAKQYSNYSFVPYEKGTSPHNKVTCEISEITENDPENRIDEQIYKYKSQVVLTVRKDSQLVSQETLNSGGTDYSKESAQVLSVIRTLEQTKKLKFEKP